MSDPCGVCGAPVRVKRIPNNDLGSRVNKFLEVEICTNEECSSHGLRSPDGGGR